MTRTLRLGFIMGGGVSLGTFAGAALTEAIKQQLVYGQYPTGKKDEAGNPIFKRYDRIEVDVCSGASAGAIALALLLRVLVNPRDQYRFLGYASYEQLRQVMHRDLAAQFGADLSQLLHQSPTTYEQLLAVQTAQAVQEKVWAKEVDLERFLGTGYYEKDLRGKASFLDRGVVDALGKRLFPFEQPQAERLKHHTLLGKRVLFGCTLANLNHTLRQERAPHIPAVKERELLQALNDSAVERVHSELRVFDLNFEPIDAQQTDNYPLRWVPYHHGAPITIAQKDQAGKVHQKTVRSLSSNAVWRELAATAIASGAVPLAFEPVVLTRYAYEFGKEWTRALADKTEYPFTYVDGGLFNNEPVKEALHLATYMDQVHPNLHADRQLIFVDPDVTELESQFRLQAHEKVALGRSIFSGRTKISVKSTPARLLSGLGHLVSALLNEAQSIEVGNVQQLLVQLEQRDQLRRLYRTAWGKLPSDADLQAAIVFLQNELTTKRTHLQLPPHVLSLPSELLRIAQEEKDFLNEQLPLEQEQALLDSALSFVHAEQPSQHDHAQAWGLILSFLMLDVALNLVGKNTATTLVPIAPFDFYKNTSPLQLLPLPGSGMAGFTGFASVEASAYELKYGQFCAKQILTLLQHIPKDTPQNLVLPSPFDYQLLDAQLTATVREAFVKRLKEMIPSSFNTVLPLLSGYLSDSVQQFIEHNLHPSRQRSSFEFRLRVPNEAYALQGFTPEGAPERKLSTTPIELANGYYLVTHLQYDFQEQQWIGPHTNFLQSLCVGQSKFFEDVPLLNIELPLMRRHSDAHRSPYPIYEADVQQLLRQNYFQDVAAQIWMLKSDVEALDQTLW